ncbi:MAG: hypothetical protein HOA08_01035 [Rhodospirillaceae bacterium]|nr:hypothetical protein [Rhodospirillaceae bacterium]
MNIPIFCGLREHHRRAVTNWPRRTEADCCNDGKYHRHECDDWETSTAFNRFEREYGSQKALEFIRAKYEDEYFKAGLALVFSTHSRRNVTHGTKNQWLLVGLIRLDVDPQADLLLDLVQ